MTAQSKYYKSGYINYSTRVIIYIRGTEIIVPRFRPRLLDVYNSHGSAKTGLVTPAPLINSKWKKEK